MFDRRITSCLPDPSVDAHGRSVRPSDAYHPRYTDSAEADRGGMESTVFLEIVV